SHQPGPERGKGPGGWRSQADQGERFQGRGGDHQEKVHGCRCNSGSEVRELLMAPRCHFLASQESIPSGVLSNRLESGGQLLLSNRYRSSLPNRFTFLSWRRDKGVGPQAFGGACARIACLPVLKDIFNWSVRNRPGTV